MSRVNVKPIRLAVLISGSGRTLKNFIDLAAEGNLPAEICLVISSSPQAGGLQHADSARIPHEVVQRKDFADDEQFGEAIFSACL